MSDQMNVVDRGKATDTITWYDLTAITGTITPVVLFGSHQDSIGIRAIRTDNQGRLLVSQSTSLFDIINSVLSDTDKAILTGAPSFRRVTFYALDMPALIAFRRADNVTTAYFKCLPNIPFTIEGIFIAVIAHNFSAGQVSTIQAIVNYDPQAGN
jgi:hypothetical protein